MAGVYGPLKSIQSSGHSCTKNYYDKVTTVNCSNRREKEHCSGKSEPQQVNHKTCSSTNAADDECPRNSCIFLRFAAAFSFWSFIVGDTNFSLLHLNHSSIYINDNNINIMVPTLMT